MLHQLVNINAMAQYANQPTYYVFRNPSGFEIQIEEKMLQKHPFSFLSRMVFSGVGRPNEEGIYQVSFESSTLDKIAEFYWTEQWPHNPYEVGNKLIIDGVDGSFDTICDYLGLPSYPYTETEDEKRSFNGLWDSDLTLMEFSELQEYQKEEELWLEEQDETMRVRVDRHVMIGAGQSFLHR